MKKSYSRVIRRLVTQTGLDPLSLAVEINASEKSIYKWMNGTSMPNCSHLLALLELLDRSDDSKKKSSSN